MAAKRPLVLYGGIPSQLHALDTLALTDSANLQEWRDSTGALVSYVTSTGALQVQGAFLIWQNSHESHIDAPATQSFIFDGGGGEIILRKGGTTATGTVRVADASGLPYVRWLSSGTTELVRVGTLGTHYAAIQSIFSGAVCVLGPNATTVACVVQGQPSQSVNLLEVQNSSAVVLFAVQSDGNLRTSNAVAATTPGSVVKKLPLYDASGTLLGYLPIYNAIT